MPNRQHQLPRPQRPGIANRRGRQAARRQLEHREVVARVAGRHGNRETPTARQNNLGSITRDNMVSFAFVNGDSTSPWRAEFTAGADASTPAGFVEAQHVDARWRSTFLLSDLIEGVLGEVDNLSRQRISVGDLDGYRVTYTKGTGDDLKQYDELYLIDERKSGVYLASSSTPPSAHRVRRRFRRRPVRSGPSAARCSGRGR